MAATGLVYALDIGVRTGFAKGRPGERVTSGSVALKRSDEDRSIAFSNLIWFLNEEWTRERPALVVKERMWSLQASSENHNSADVVLVHAALHGIIEGMCWRFGIPWDRDRHDVADSTIRKHFIGVGRLGSREQTKAAVIRRCKVLKLVPIDCNDDNRADAIAVWDWACATLCRQPPRELHLFGERA